MSNYKVQIEIWKGWYSTSGDTGNKVWGSTLETLDFTIRIGTTPAFSYFDLYPYSAYAAHYSMFKL